MTTIAIRTGRPSTGLRLQRQRGRCAGGRVERAAERASELPAGRASERPAGRAAGRPAGRGADPAAGQGGPVRHVRLTRRGRAVVVVGLVLLLLAAFSLGRVGAVGSTDAAAPPQVEVTTVAPGETLWKVAKRIAPGQDPRPVVDQIIRLNDLPGAGLRAGQQLLLPVRG